MSLVFVKIRTSGKGCKYRKMLSTEEELYPPMEELIDDVLTYAPGASLGEEEWFRIENVSKQPFSIDLITDTYETPDFPSLSREEFDYIDYVFVKNGNNIYFQKVGRAKLASKRSLMYLGEAFYYQADRTEIVINNVPDAIYCPDTDMLFFRKLESVVTIFKGINELYREATQTEVEEFMNLKFVALSGDYSAAKVKTANRKRIALVKDSLATLNKEEQKKMKVYIEEYCPQLKTKDGAFLIGDEEELKWLLYGVQEKFYTTVIGKERRLANSTIKMEA